MYTRRPQNFLKTILHNLFVVVGAFAFTVALFFVLPLIQAMADGPKADTELRDAPTIDIPPPDEMMEEEEEPPEQEEEEPPELEPEVEPMDLNQLELALNPGGMGSGVLQGDFGLDLNTMAQKADDVDALFSMSDLDSKPRAIYQPGPRIDAQVRKHSPGTVYIIFIVDQNGRVQNAKVKNTGANHPSLGRAALNAVKKWKFEPVKRKGKTVRFTMRVPITFPEGL